MTQWSTGQSLLALVVLLAVLGLLTWLAARHVQREAVAESEVSSDDRTPRPRTGAVEQSPALCSCAGPASSQPQRTATGDRA
jgi:hypothetical protein